MAPRALPAKNSNVCRPASKVGRPQVQNVPNHRHRALVSRVGEGLTGADGERREVLWARLLTCAPLGPNVWLPARAPYMTLETIAPFAR